MKEAFNRQGGMEKFRAESILAQKMTRLRLALVLKMNDPQASFSTDEYKAFVENIRAMLENSHAFDVEARNAHIAMDRLEAPRTPDLSTPEKQLLWAASLFYIHRTKTRESYYGGEEHTTKVNLKITSLWQQIQSCPDAVQVLYDQGVYICEELRNPDFRFIWGDPDTGIKYDSYKKGIGVDLLYALAVGLEHTGSLMLREIGRNRLGRAPSEQRNRLRDTILRLNKKESVDRNLSGSEYKMLRKAALEWQMREMLWKAAENCTTSRYTERKGRETAQNHAYSLNYIQMAGTPFGHEALVSLRGLRMDAQEDEHTQALGFLRQAMDKKRKELLKEGATERQADLLRKVEKNIRDIDQELWKLVPPATRFLNIVNAVELSFFRNNGLFENTRSGWERLGIRPDLVKITKEGDAHNDREEDGLPPDFSYLLELCGGENGLENMQPDAHARWQGKAYFNALTHTHAARRSEIIETIWDLYVQDIFEEMAQALEQEIDRQLENEQNQRGLNQKDEQAKNSQEKQNRGEKKQQPQKRPGGQEGMMRQGDSSSGGGGSFGAGEKPFSAAGDDDSGNESSPENAAMDSFDPMNVGTNPWKMDVKNDRGQEKKMASVKAPSENPEGQNMDADESGQSMDQGGDGQDENKGAEGKTLEEIRQALEKALKEAAEQEQKNTQNGNEGKQQGQGQGQGQSQGQAQGEAREAGEKSGKAASEGAGKGEQEKTLEDIASGVWQSYAQVKSDLAGYINRTGRLLRQIRDRQIEKTTARSDNLEMLPEDMDLSRLNDEAQKNLILKQKAGRQEKDDFNRFHKDKTDHKPTKIDIVLLVDGSGSMTMEGYKLGKAKPMDIALLSSIILYEAAKEVDANVYIALWGNNDPVMLAKPGDDIRTIDKNLLAAKNGLDCGTYMAPSIGKITKILADHREGGYSGYTHMMVISDGDISDADETVKNVNALLSTNEYATLEFAILKKEGDRKTDMEKVAEKVKSSNPAQKIGIYRSGDPNAIPAGILGLIFQKIRILGTLAAVPWGKKRKLFQQAQKGFGMK